MYQYRCCQCCGGICRHNTDNIINDMHVGTRYVILAKHWMWLPDDGDVWTETCWSSFYNFNYFNNLRISQFVCISWKIECLILLMHGATMNYILNVSWTLPCVSGCCFTEVHCTVLCHQHIMQHTCLYFPIIFRSLDSSVSIMTRLWETEEVWFSFQHGQEICLFSK
jgi:hypothetical protein